MNLAGLLMVLAAAPAAPMEPVREDRDLMHTTVTVVIADRVAEPRLSQAFDDAFSVFADIEDTMNEWKSDSALGQINAGAGGAPVRAPAPLCAVIRLSLEGARETDGLFDPTWAALKGLWRFGDGEPHALPASDLVERACKLVNYRDVEVKPVPGSPDCTVRLKRAGMQLGLGGVVKGWGVDQAVARLRARGMKNFFVQAGGDLYFAGKKAGRPWRSGIRDPRGAPDQSFAKLDVEDRAFSTSGDYEHFFVLDEVRYHHIIDLRSCWPARASRSVTVLARSATDAEFLTKSAFVLGGEPGLKLVERHGGAAVIVDAANAVHVSKALSGKLELSSPSP